MSNVDETKTDIATAPKLSHSKWKTILDEQSEWDKMINKSIKNIA